MKALILAAGLGSRLKHKTKAIPKAMIDVGGQPIITYQISALLKNNINQIGVVLGYKSEVLKSYLVNKYSNIHFSFFLNKDYATTNSAYSFYLASSFIKTESYIHLNCDVLFSSELLSGVINSNHENVLAVNLNEKLTDNMELVTLNELNRIIIMDNKYYNSAAGKAYGVAKLSSESTKIILNRLERYHINSDFNQNYYGIIRQVLSDVDYHCFESKNMTLTEIITLTDYDRVIKNL